MGRVLIKLNSDRYLILVAMTYCAYQTTWYRTSMETTSDEWLHKFYVFEDIPLYNRSCITFKLAYGLISLIER